MECIAPVRPKGAPDTATVESVYREWSSVGGWMVKRSEKSSNKINTLSSS